MPARSRCFSVTIAAIALCCSASVRAAQADTIFDVSGIFDDNNSTPLLGTFTLSSTNALDGFDFNIPTMINGSTTLAGALFTPATATASFSDFGPAAFLSFQLLGATPEGETLFLLIPEPIATPFAGSALLQAVSSGGQVFHTGYQSGPQSNPFFELKDDGTIAAAAPEPSAYLFLGLGVAGILVVRRTTSRG
jgi:hypothetical protein